MTNTSLTADYTYYARVAQSAGRNATMAFLSLGVIWFVAKLWLAAAKAIFWLGLVLNALNAAHVLFLTALGLIVFFGGARESKWAWAANGARLVEVALCAVAVWLSAHIVGYL